MEAIYQLIDNQADIYAVNKSKLNMLHVAAQGDSAAPIQFFKILGLNLNLTDEMGCTPLHWAVFSNSEIAFTYLLAFSEIDVNARD